MTGFIIGDMLRESLYVMLKLSLPLMLIALVVGVIISLIQALTQIQEQSLTFVPKMIAMFAGLLIMFSFLSQTILSFGENIFVKITQLND